MRRIAANCRILITTTRAVLNDPELSNFEKILYSVLYTDRIAEILSIKWFLLEKSGNDRQKNRSCCFK